MLNLHATRQRIAGVLSAVFLAAPVRSEAPAEVPTLGLPVAATSADGPATPAQIALGSKLFFDKRLSRGTNTSCATCHQPHRAFTDGLPVAQGDGNATGARNTPTLLNASYNRVQFWDGRRTDLESQALDPLLNAREHGLSDLSTLLNLLRDDREYVIAFQRAFADGMQISASHVAIALASYERTLVAGNSPFDQYYFGQQHNAMSASAQRGLALFTGRAGCVSCHMINNDNALFTDQMFHDVSGNVRALGSKVATLSMSWLRRKAAGQSFDEALLSEPEIAKLGRFVVSGNPRDLGMFRTPSLRNVAKTAPYMHDGSVATLELAIEVELYYRNSLPNQPPLVLTVQEKTDLTEFLRALDSQ